MKTDGAVENETTKKLAFAGNAAVIAMQNHSLSVCVQPQKLFDKLILQTQLIEVAKFQI